MGCEGVTTIYVVILRLLSRSLSEGTAESGFGSNQLLVFEVAHDAQR